MSCISGDLVPNGLTCMPGSGWKDPCEYMWGIGVRRFCITQTWAGLSTALHSWFCLTYPQGLGTLSPWWVSLLPWWLVLICWHLHPRVRRWEPSHHSFVWLPCPPDWRKLAIHSFIAWKLAIHLVWFSGTLFGWTMGWQTWDDILMEIMGKLSRYKASILVDESCGTSSSDLWWILFAASWSAIRGWVSIAMIARSSA